MDVRSYFKGLQKEVGHSTFSDPVIFVFCFRNMFSDTRTLPSTVSREATESSARSCKALLPFPTLRGDAGF